MGDLDGVLVLDTETTGATNDTYGSAFCPENVLCLVGMDSGHDDDIVDIEYSSTPYGAELDRVARCIRDTRILVGFNIKFDLHWLRRYGIDFSHCSLWDCQLVHFILTSQQFPDPSLGEVAAHYSLGEKLDVVKTEFWDKDIDTDQVPLEILSDYLRQDVFLTKEIYSKQRKELGYNPLLRKVCWLSCQDILVTQEMEWNGLKFDIAKSYEGAVRIRSEIAKIDEGLNEYVRDCPWFNWNSGEHLSALLYGGVVRGKQREEVDFIYKDGRTAKKLRWVDKSFTFPPMVAPLKGTQLQKGHYQTSLPVLQQLSGAKRLRESLLARAALEQRVSTYYEGWPKLYERMGWDEEIIHGNLNHTRARTLRLSSSKPNQQNKDKEFEECIVTRF